MKLRKMRVEGFQSFGDSGDIELADGFNLIIGQNNGGKSALLRSICCPLADDRHRTPIRWETFELPTPVSKLNIQVSGDELRRGLLRFGGQYRIPAPQPVGHNEFLENLWNLNSLEFELIRTPGNPARMQHYPSHRIFNLEPGAHSSTLIVGGQNGTVALLGMEVGNADSLPNLVEIMWQEDMFAFTAERMTIGESGHGLATRLTANASNLPAVLLTLNGNRGDVFAKLVSHLREIFSTVGNLSVTPTANGSIEVRIWPTAAMERVELSFPLNSSGTGVSQVIAILTAIMTAENAVIIIDEINSFLHPAAVKALLRVLQTEYAHHQYIISTHAPEVIAFCNPKTIHLVKRDGYESVVERLDLTEVGQFREVAEHLGVSMADVFAAERIIWVEGPTEEMSFPYLYQQMSGEPMPRGTIFTSVAATGDFNRKRDRAIVYEVYSRLSSAAATLVVSVVFSFDTEELSDADKENMVRDSGGRLKFLPRRHIECYLLDPSAIATMIVGKDPKSAETATPDAVKIGLIALASDMKFHIAEWNSDLTDDVWLAKVDAAKMISEVTATLSEQRATFNKKEDSLGLIRDIHIRNTANLEPLYNYVQSLVDAVTVE